jgi:hypothetical protein
MDNNCAHHWTGWPAWNLPLGPITVHGKRKLEDFLAFVSITQHSYDMYNKNSDWWPSQSTSKAPFFFGVVKTHSIANSDFRLDYLFRRGEVICFIRQNNAASELSFLLLCQSENTQQLDFLTEVSFMRWQSFCNCDQISHVLFSSRELRFDKGSTIRSRDICWSSLATNWSSQIQLFASHCHCLPWWAWLSDWILQVPGMNIIALHMVLILESMESGSRETDGDKAIGATFSMKFLPWSCGDLCFLGCNQKFCIFGWHKLWDWWSEKLVKQWESQ